MILFETDYMIIVNALKHYKKDFDERTMTYHDLGHLIEHFEELEKKAKERGSGADV
jgi:hypothetical protein